MEPLNKDILEAIDRSMIGYAIFHRDGRVVHASSSARYLLGFSPQAELIGKRWHQLDHDTEKMQSLRWAAYEDFLASRAHWQGVLRWVWPDGSKRYYDSTASYYSDDQIVIVLNDRTEQVLAQRKLQERERLISNILDRLPLGIMLQDRDGTIRYINNELARSYGVRAQDAIGRKPHDVPGLEYRNHIEPLFDEALASGAPVTGRPLRVNAGPLKGTHWLVHLYPLAGSSGTLDRLLTVEFDRTDRVRLAEEKSVYQRKLHELQKIEALNRFAGGLAHELSNILHPAGVYARALKAQPDQPDREKLLERINTAVLQAGEILRQTLSMARGGTSGLKPVDLKSFLEDLLSYAQDVATTGLVYHLDIAGDDLIAMADDVELRQVMLNLIVNASDAQNATGNIFISAGRGGIPPAEMDIAPLSAGPFVWIEVQDEGNGISAETRANIFEPFFTTKKRGKGIGLGLAVVQGMVTGWGGIVSVRNSAKGGAVFRVWMPESRAHPQVPAVPQGANQKDAIQKDDGDTE
ncbi:PAS domain-containing protein [Aquisalinus flavus]|uniref:histidine kinase n=1 Tax=Aquisalinus flavus TaxID=1526572 RepID=A0A8J2V234_9PROT|nr:PAS domain-containing protein [Aquisalinus flavus]MBD0426951.1 PAS domain-containing protein [Aquisalinus flavus]UNE46790.1 PAS domain S-box protein [Aquisalinus flavus]GGC97192.1 hypothetical protein GCM10011342_02640 [Aquisalinus flavus]